VYIILPPIQLILIFILVCPILIWHAVVYLPEEYYCHMPLSNIRSMLWLLFTTYGIPLLLLSLIYFRITRFLRRQANNQIVVGMKQRQQRDLLVLQRIFILVGFLLILGIPIIVFMIMFYITGEEYPLVDRVVWFSFGLSMIGLSFAVVIVTPQLKSIVLQKFQQNRIIPVKFIVLRSIQIQQNTIGV
jgi:hypothetical protein